MKRRIMSIALACTMMVGLSACGSASTTTESAAAESETAEAVSEAATGDDTAADGTTVTLNPNTKGAEEITLWHYFDASADAQAIVEKCNEYNELQDDVYIVPTYVSRPELMDQYTIGAVSGELPDIGMVDSPDMESYISLGVFESIQDEIGDWEDLDKFYPGPLSSCQDAEGNLYGLPQNSNCLALAVNMDLLNAAGIEEAPSNLEEFKEAVAATTDAANGVYGFSMCAISTEEGTFQILPWLVATHDGTKTSLTDITGCADGLDVIGEFVQNGYMSSECVNWTQADAYNQFAAGKAAMEEIGTWQLASIADDVNGAFNYKIVLLPTGDEGTSSSTIGGENFGVCSGATNKEACVEFLKWFTSAEQEELWSVQAGKLPVRSDANPEYTYEQEGFEVFLDEMNYALARGPHAQWPTISEQIYTAAQKVMLQGTSAADALSAAADVINPILEEDPLPEQQS